MRSILGMAVLAATLLAGTMVQAQPAPGGPVTIESYYRIKWGSADEFKALYRRNHHPILVEMQKQGFIKSMRMDLPYTHMAGGPRWDVRVTITYADPASAMPVDGPFDTAWQAAEKRLYPDNAALKAAEARRFAMLEDHWDVIVVESTAQ
jgi:hypothetical protein